jgi:hypothetical protein
MVLPPLAAQELIRFDQQAPWPTRDRGPSGPVRYAPKRGAGYHDEALGGSSTEVEAYVPDQIGDGKYLPHLTVGAGKFEDLKIIEAEPFDGFDVHPVAVAVYHLGNNGTARKLLKEWPLT